MHLIDLKSDSCMLTKDPGVLFEEIVGFLYTGDREKGIVATAWGYGKYVRTKAPTDST